MCELAEDEATDDETMNHQSVVRSMSNTEDNSGRLTC